MTSVAKMLYNILLLLYYLLESIVLAFVPKRMRYKNIAGEIALITGGGSGIGRLLSIRFADLGATIVVWDLNLEAARETVKLIEERGGEAYAFHCDVSKSKNVYDAATKVKREVGKVTILVNNAGIVCGKRFLDIPDDMIQETFEVNALAHFWTCKAFLPDMMEDNHGHIVSIASIVGLIGASKVTDYSASKFAAVGFEESLRLELLQEGYTGIHSTVVCPYVINTGMFNGVKPGLLSMLSPEYVADEIVSAVLINQEVILIPKKLSVLFILKSLFSGKTTKMMMLLTESETMNTFTGRKKVLKSN